MTNSQILKNKFFIWTLIIIISLNLVVGMYFTLFEKDILESLFPSTIPFWVLCFCDAILIFSLCLLIIKQREINNLLSPNTERRGFLFMDLDSSTIIAETLGHKLYSSFLKDTFSALEQIIEEIKGLEVYQYVGDEAVLSWKLSNESVNQLILYLQPNFQKLLKEKEEYFKDEYGFNPTFKCAIHGGEVTKTFLGKNQVQTAFHGDVLNTTSRILGLCHQFNTCVLVSKLVYEKAKTPLEPQIFEQLEAVDIEGKTKKIYLFKMNQNDFNNYRKVSKNQFLNLKNDYQSNLNILLTNYEKQKK